MRGPVTTLLDGLQYPTAIAVDEAHLFVADAIAGSVIRVDRRGGVPVVLADDLACPFDLVLDATHLFVTLCSEEDSAVLRIPKGGGAPTVIARSPAFAAALAIDEERVYWTTLGEDRDSGCVCAAPRAGGDLTLLAQGQHGPTGIAVDASSVYWLDSMERVLALEKGSDARRVILHQPAESVEERLVNGEPAPARPPGEKMLNLMVDPSPPPLRRIVVQDENVYWQSASGSIAVVGSWDSDRPPSLPQLLTVDRSLPSAVCLDDEWAYWTDGRAGRIRRVRRSCGTPRTVAAGQHRPLAITLDDDAVYWAVGGALPDFEGGAVRMRRR